MKFAIHMWWSFIFLYSFTWEAIIPISASVVYIYRKVTFKVLSLFLVQVDVFSFGIVMWEILTGEEPYANMHYGAIIGIQFIAYI